MTVQPRPLRLLAWETTSACTLACPHCRAAATLIRDEGELSTSEAEALLTATARLGPVIVILSGGEPLLRDDLEALVSYGTTLGLRMVLATNDGRLLTAERIRNLADAGLQRVSFSMHDDRPEGHDRFVRWDGAHSAATGAFARLAAAGVELQVNTSIARHNFERLREIHQRVCQDWRPAAWHLFFLVPTGRAIGQGTDLFLANQEVETVLHEVTALSVDSPVPIQVTCAPMYQRILAQTGRAAPRHGRACMAGDGFLFVGARGEVRPCGYFNKIVGNVRETPLDQLYLGSADLHELRDPAGLQGRCRGCQYRTVCGGCRARALAHSGQALADDPLCIYQPQSQSAGVGDPAT